MSDSTNTVTEWVMIERPILDVFEYVTNPRNLSEWVPLYSDVEVPDGFACDSPNHDEFRVIVGMRPLAITDTVRAFNRVMGRSITFRSKVLAQTATYLFEPTSHGTMLTAIHVPWGWSNINPWIGLIRPAAQSTLKQSLLQLKQRLEAMRHRPTPKRIFFSYRREHDEYTGGRVVESLAREFGHGAIFRDIDSIRSGSFEDRISDALNKCDVVVAFIGANWVDSFKRPAEKDYVRKELVKALELALSREGGRKRLTVVPVILASALRGHQSIAEFVESFPDNMKELKELGSLQILRLRPDPDFRQDMEAVTAAAWEAIREKG